MIFLYTSEYHLYYCVYQGNQRFKLAEVCKILLATKDEVNSKLAIHVLLGTGHWSLFLPI